MDTIEARILEQDELRLWDDLVDRSPYGTVFQKSFWLLTAARETGMSTDIIGAFSQDKLIGGCAVHYHHVASIFTAATTALPLTPYGGVVIRPLENTKIRERERDEWAITKSVISCIEKRRPHFISLTMCPQYIDIRPYTWTGWKENVKYCYIFPLSGDIAEQISKKVRWSINTALKSEIVAERKFDRDIYWDLTRNTYHRQGKEPPFSQNFLYSLIDKIQEEQCGEMWIARTSEGEAASAEIILWDQKTAYRWSAASSDLYKDTGATSYLISEIMTHLKKKGFEEINLMAANTPNLAKFISSFNPKIVPYYSVEKAREVFKIFSAVQSIIR